MNSRIPSRSLKVQNLVALGTRSAALLAKKPAVADLAAKLVEANERLDRANTARVLAGVARFNACQDRLLADDALETVVRLAQCAVLQQCEGFHGHPSYRAAFPKGQTPLVVGPSARRIAALSDLGSVLKADPAHADLATRFDEALAAWKAAVEAHAVARGAETRAVLQLLQARAEWVMDYTAARAESMVRLRNAAAVKALFPYSVRKADVGTEPGTPETPAGKADAPAGKAETAATPGPKDGSPPPAQDLKVA